MVLLVLKLWTFLDILILTTINEILIFKKCRYGVVDDYNVVTMSLMHAVMTEMTP